MSNKHLIKLIQKYAQDADLEDPDKLDKPRPVAPVSNFSPAIQEMQRQMMSLAKLVVSQINVTDITKTTGPIDPKDPAKAFAPEAHEAASRNSFGDFIAKRLRKAKIPGVEFDPTKTKTDMKDKNPSVATRMGVIMDTMMRVGGGKAEEVADGKWGPRTNAALHNVYAFAAAMLKLASDFETPIKSYTTAYLDDLEARIPDSETEFTFEQKKTQAPLIGKHIAAIIKMFHEIKEGVLELPDYQSYIEGEAYATYDKGGEGPDKKSAQPLTPEAIASMQKTFKDGFPILVRFDEATDKDVTLNISVNDLRDIEALKAWIYNNKLGRLYTPAQIIEQVRNRAQGIEISSVPPKHTPLQDQARADRDWAQEQAKAKAIRDGKAT